MFSHPLLRPFFDPPARRRDKWLMGLGFGLFWVIAKLFDHRLLQLPDALLPATLLLQGSAELLPPTWTTIAAVLRITALVAGIIGAIWFVVQLAGWLF